MPAPKEDDVLSEEQRSKRRNIPKKGQNSRMIGPAEIATAAILLAGLFCAKLVI